IAVYQLLMCKLTRRYRRQASSHSSGTSRKMAVCPQIAPNSEVCGKLRAYKCRDRRFGLAATATARWNKAMPV
ncbi:hypothetical protein, partial [Pseudomonas sp. CBZ-4]|uniref:hypothetical protein n=1 Tax=Pseudomonas sp. CBZ-4 TaxID=1163065 RepID=UPI001C494F54